MQAQKAGAWPTAYPNYIEDVFSTYLYKGTGANQTINTGIDTSTKGGMVWVKSRVDPVSNDIFDTARGAGHILWTNSTGTDNYTTDTQKTLTSFNTNGFSLGDDAGAWGANSNGYMFASWTFRKQPKFFDVVTYTYTGTSQQVSHSLDGTVGAIIVKRTDASQDWLGWFRRTGATTGYSMSISTVEGNAGATAESYHTSTYFTPGQVRGSNAGGTVQPVVGGTYVAYIFAHNSGGFGVNGTDNVISCGSFISTGSTISVDLGYEPQWLLYKEGNSTGDWKLIDSVRGFQVDRSSATLQLNPNSTAAEASLGVVGPTSTGFTFNNGGSGVTYIYMAIRKGPMKVPTDGTKVFAPVIGNSSSPAPYIGFATSFTLDATIYKAKAGSAGYAESRLQGSGVFLQTSATSAETTAGGSRWDRQTGLGLVSSSDVSNYIGWMFKRAPGFFDEVCYTGTGAVGLEVKHNLGVAPELVIWKARNTTYPWPVQTASMGWTTNAMYLNTTAAKNADYYMTADPTATSMFLRSENYVNSSFNYVAYLFATCPGVSKVGSYTGNGSSQTLNCGFAAGARFVMIKRTDSTGDWYVWDTARGIVAGNDPHLSLNTTVAEVTTNDTIDTASSGFIVNQLAATNVNVNAATYIYLAIA